MTSANQPLNTAGAHTAPAPPTEGGVNPGAPTAGGARYQRPGRLVRVLRFDAIVAFLVRRGVDVWGARVLSVRGRKSGEPRTTPVNLLTVDGVQYLVAPRGHTQWVRNLRAAGEGELGVGKRVQRFTAHELPDEAKPAVLRAYLKRWSFEVGAFFTGVNARSTDEELRAVGPDHPVFRVSTQD
ncbi:nitroreductase family deazaflavin-dependent oxidoreductase [Actinokineospora diospyrosa]|uniref:Deazaflavin-dependent oxidoreductase, nitroreductase family n=1 Tax=Actinokineospora diospyrosa TaxID=103728 RepID=A0ABT1I4X3_9PSEU|nr:nitroreductase family deazaflavin-dependent oxidoreductase [Actinokineospora diospyrosa]MCP2267662.1 deazaflavin-dependent oxidoreductase, nitroreductase family [Actinokineospora diospyrosa]